MENDLKTEHRGWAIGYNEYMNSWTGRLDALSIATSRGLAELRKKIDAALKKESKFKDMRVIVETGNGYSGHLFMKATITSVSEDGETWIKNDEGRREKLYKSAVIYADTDGNLKILSDMEGKRNQAKELENERKELQETLETVKPS